MSFDANQRVSQSLLILTQPLFEYVGREMVRYHGDGWRNYLSVAKGGDRQRPDVYALLKTMIDYWPTVFRPVLKPGDRNALSTAFDARNETMHAGGPLDPERAVRHLLGIKELAAAIGAKEAAKSVGTLLTQQMGDATGVVPTEVASPSRTPAPSPAAAAKPQLTLAPAATVPSTLALDVAPRNGLKPWTEISPPAADVLASRGREMDFAANLATVVAGRAPEAYGDARAFFRGTYLTQGLCAVLSRGIARLTKTGGEPVIGLQTGFGGGKTHTMLALYHLASANDPETLPGLGPLFADAGAATLRSGSKPFVFVGTEGGPDMPLGYAEGTPIRNIWGQLAWHLGGNAGFERVRAADAAGTNPGSALLMDLLDAAAPCLILLDEVAAYARQLTGTRYEAFLSFIQSLTEAAKAVDGVLVVGSLPQSEIEVGGEQGKAVLGQLAKVFGRIGSPWAAADGVEQFEIVRRRLFQALDEDGERARDATIKAFQKYYGEHRGEFPAEVTEAAFATRMRASYPVHPELFRILQEDWPNLERFQRTRGVLQLVGQIAYRLWQSEVKTPLLLPGHVPLADGKVRAEVTDPLLDGYKAVLEREVAGEASRPRVLETTVANFGRTRAPTAVATSLFIATAPFGPVQQGVPIARLRLGCAMPGDQPSVFGEALRRMQETSAYLYAEGDRYWFSTQPTLNQLADDKARGYEAAVVDADIDRRLRDEEKLRTPGGFPRLHFGLPDPTVVEEALEAALIAFGPTSPHDPKRPLESLARRLAVDVLEKRGNGQRLYRNRLYFVAADAAALEDVRRAVRQARAWSSIASDDDLSGPQKREAVSRSERAEQAAVHALRTAWKHLFWPDAAANENVEDSARGFAIETVAITNRNGEGIAKAAWEKARGDAVNEQLGAPILKLDLDKVWPADRTALPLSDLRDWYFRFPYLTRLRDVTVLTAALNAALGRIDADFGSGQLGADGETIVSVTLDRPASPGFAKGAVLLRRADALTRLQPASTPSPTTVGAPASPAEPRPATSSSAPPVAGHPNRFYMTVDLDPQRPGPLVSQIALSILSELSRVPGAIIKLKLDIEAKADLGYPQDVVDTVRDNSATLKIELMNFERE